MIPFSSLRKYYKIYLRDWAIRSLLELLDMFKMISEAKKRELESGG